MPFLHLLLLEAMPLIILKCCRFSFLAANEAVGEMFQWKSWGAQIAVHTFCHCLTGLLIVLHFQGALCDKNHSTTSENAVAVC